MGELALVAALRTSLAEDARALYVVAPSARAARHLARAALAPGEARLGVAFTTWDGLARALLRRLRRPAPRELHPLVEKALLLQAVAARGQGPLAEVLTQPASLPSFVQAWHEVGRADPRAREEAALGATARELLALAKPRTAVLALTEALAAGPHDLAGVRVITVGSLPPDGLHACLGERLVASGAAVVRVPYTKARAPQRELWCAPDLAGEARLAAQLCSEAHARGIPFERMLVVAPQLGPYVPYLRAAFDAERVPFAALATTPLGREPRGAAYVHAARVLWGEAPRTSFTALRISPLAQRPTATALMAELERIARMADAGGHDATTKALAAAFPEIPAGAPSTALLRAFGERHLVAPTPGTRDALVAEALEEVFACLDELGAVRGEVTAESFVRDLEEALDGRGLPLASEGADTDTGVVAVVEAGQALGFPAEHLHLLGLSARQVPGAAPDESFLGDGDRKALGLPTQETLRERELALLGACLTHAERSVVLSRPARDGDGRETEPSLWRDELWRSLGGGDPEGAEGRAPMHPLARAEARIAKGECPSDLALTALALEGADPEALAPLLPEGRKAIPARARVLEAFAGTELARDAILGAGRGPDPTRSLSVSALQTLARCPQRFWFQQAVGRAPLPALPEAMTLPRDRLGTAVHEALRAAEEGVLERLRAAPDPRAFAPEMLQIAERHLHDGIRASCGDVLRTLPNLLAVLGESWQQALARTLVSELAHLHEHEARPLAVEQEVRATLAVRRRSEERAHALALHGRIDRLDRLAGGGVGIVDYKTGTRLGKATEPRGLVRGTGVQLVAYALLLEAQRKELRVTSLAAVAVSPENDPEEVPRKEVKRTEDLLHGELAPEVLDTLATLQELRLAGAFPLAHESEDCGHCEWHLACRRLHPPTVARVSESLVPELARYRALATKVVGPKKRAETPDAEEDDAP